mmetsp:Transcript_40042/g.124680  ORF Transcript_40042/g.124680 Transcript_40042/m.124680 type:complete len:131 (+) Transcript_40042:125-517(+)
MHQEAIQDIIRVLHEEPSKIVPALHIIRGKGLLPKHWDDIASKKPFPTTYVKLHQLPKRTLINMLPKLEPTIFNNPDLCKRLESAAKRYIAFRGSWPWQCRLPPNGHDSRMTRRSSMKCSRTSMNDEEAG